MMASQGLRPGLLTIEVALIAGVFWADEAGWVPLSKTPFLFLVAWGSLRLRGLGWRGVGLRLPEGWPRLAAIGVATGIAMWLLEFFVTMPVLHRALGYWPDLTDFNDIVGNAKLLAVFLALNWVLAAFGEEMVWRGYALSRVAQFCGSGTRAWVLALVVVNVAFGLAHLYQGPSGVIQATVAGVLLG
ncbi:MAG: CPBP family intramembrane glutamic endopeptidase, partial [Steroidobacteraceae bacterium]